MYIPHIPVRKFPRETRARERAYIYIYIYRLYSRLCFLSASRWVAEYKLAKAEEKDLLDFIAKWGAKAAKATQAKDREKKLERLRSPMRPPPPSEILALAATVSDEAQKLRQANAAAKGKAASSAAEFDARQRQPRGRGHHRQRQPQHEPRADADGAAAGGERLSARRGSSLRLPPPPDCGQVPVALEGASFGWPPRGADGGAVAPVATEVDFEITKGMRVIVRGPNGAGKSTLARALAGTLPLAAGARVADERLALGYFTQDLSQELAPRRARSSSC